MTRNPGQSDSPSNTEDCRNVPVGAYVVTETSPPTGFTLISLTCTSTGSGSSGGTIFGAMVFVKLAAAGDVVTCTYVNKQQTGEIRIIKHTDPRGSDQGFNFTSTNIAGGVVVVPRTPRASR